MYLKFKNVAEVAKLQGDFIANVGLKEDMRDLPLRPAEEELIQTSIGYRFLDWKRTSMKTPNVFTSTTVQNDALRHWGKFVTRVDTSAESLLASFLQSRRTIRIGTINESNDILYVNGTRSFFRIVSVNFTPPFKSRELAVWSTWDLRMIDGKPTGICAYTDMSKHPSSSEPQYRRSKDKRKVIQGNVRGVHLMQW